MTAKERATISLPADLTAAAKAASGGDLSAYIERALRERQLRQAGAPRRGTRRHLRRGRRVTVQPQALARGQVWRVPLANRTWAMVIGETGGAPDTVVTAPLAEPVHGVAVAVDLAGLRHLVCGAPA
ncbi:hypothetical protein L7D48_03210 [Streptomyces sp. S1A]|nr:hypothetical protein [Streptomyces sp. ICN903]